jgi:hypothetical protein
MPARKRKAFSKSCYDRKMLEQGNRCSRCIKPFYNKSYNIGRPKKHHIDGDRTNVNCNNLAIVCAGCHEILTEKQDFERQQKKVLPKQKATKKQGKGFFDFGNKKPDGTRRKGFFDW